MLTAVFVFARSLWEIRCVGAASTPSDVMRTAQGPYRAATTSPPGTLVATSHQIGP